MISERLQRIKYIGADFIATNIGIFMFDIFRYKTLEESATRFTSLTNFLYSLNIVLEQTIIPFLLLIFYWLSGYYNKPFQKSRLQELITTIFSCILISLLIYFALLTNDQIHLRLTNYTLLLALFLFLLIPLYLLRLTITSVTIKHIKKGHWNFPTIIAGNSDMAKRMQQQLYSGNKTNGYNIVARVALPGEDSTNSPDDTTPVFPFDSINEIVKTFGVRYLILVPESHDDSYIMNIIGSLFHLNIPIKIAPDTLSILTSSIKLQDIYGEPFIDVSSPNISESTKNIKRLIDVSVSAIALILLAIPMIVIAWKIKSDSKGSVFYFQERVGYRQRRFKICKFRTMVADAESSGPQLSSPTDIRITKIGKFLRKYRIDELPQFWNVLCGDMSLVGPRPERAYFIEKIIKRAPFYTLIHQVRPGITSWGMVKYGYASTVDEMVQRLQFDLIYLSNMSTAVDIKILIYTIKTVLMGKGM